MQELDSTSPKSSILDGYLTEDQLSAETGKSKRTLREYRQKQMGPPWVSWGNTVLYPRDGFRAYLKAIEKTPRLRSGKAA